MINHLMKAPDVQSEANEVWLCHQDSEWMVTGGQTMAGSIGYYLIIDKWDGVFSLNDEGWGHYKALAGKVNMRKKGTRNLGLI